MGPVRLVLGVRAGGGDRRGPALAGHAPFEERHREHLLVPDLAVADEAVLAKAVAVVRRDRQISGGNRLYSCGMIEST